MTTNKILYSITAGHVPSGLVSGQIAINIADGILFWNDNNGVLKNFNFTSPTVPTLGGSDNSTHVANTSFVQSLITNLLGNAPSGLNTIGALAAAIGNNPLFYQILNACIRFDQAQTLSGTQLAQIQANIGLPASTLATIDAMSSTGLQVNGGMEIDQLRNGGSLVIPKNTYQYAIDQWAFVYQHAANTAAFTTQRISSPGSNVGVPIGSYLTITATGALTAPAAADCAYLDQPIEGYRWERLNYGLSNARPVTIGFWVNTSVTGTATLAVRNSASTRSYVSNFSVPSANTWQWITVTIPGDVAGTWLSGINVGAHISFCFASGTSFQGINNTWSAGTFIATSQTTNFFTASNSQVNITGVVIFPGNNAPTATNMSLTVRPYGEELALCQRYFSTAIGAILGNGISGNSYIATDISFPVQMRVIPTVTAINTPWATLSNVSGGVNVWYVSQDGFGVYVLSAAAGNVQANSVPSTGFSANARM